MNENVTDNRGSIHLPMSGWRSLFPILQWLPKYKRSFFSWDVLAGITLASFVLPESMAYATLAGLPVQAGIYCCLAAGLFFAFFTTARHVAVGPTSAISLMVGTTVAVLAGGDSSRWIAIAGLTALVITAICIVAYLFKLSTLVNFISESILLGFKAGAALSIAATQLPKIFGVEGGGANFFERIAVLAQHLPSLNWAVLAFGLIALALLLTGENFFPGRPVSLLVVIASIVVLSVTSLSSYGIHVTGDIPGGLPSIARPSLRLRDVDGVLELAFACFLMGYIETVSAARTFAMKNNYEINPRQELLSMGAANFAAAFAGGYPVAGGLSQSTVNEKSGAKTPMSLIICSLTLAVLLLFFTGLLKNLPEVLLAVIVIHAVVGLIKVKELRRLYQLSKLEFLVAMIAVAGVLFFGILKGVMIAVLMSIAFLLRRTATPNVAVLGRIGTTDRYSDIKRHPDNKEIEGIKIVRVESSILYFNANHIQSDILQKLSLDNNACRLLILDMSASPAVDVSGSKMLLQLSNELKQRGIIFRIVEALADVRDLLRLLGMEEITGHISRRDSVNNVVEEFTMGKLSTVNNISDDAT